MAILGQIDFNEVHTNDELLPAGEYQAIIVASGARPEDPQTAEGYVISRSGKGAYLPMTFEVCAGEFKGRQIRKNFNLKNTNPDAVRIARGELKQLLLALNWDFAKKPCGPEDTSEIHMIPLVVKVAQAENKQTGDLQNEIKRFLPLNGSQPAQQAVVAPMGTAPMVKPWLRVRSAEPVVPPKEETTQEQRQEQAAEAPKA